LSRAPVKTNCDQQSAQADGPWWSRSQAASAAADIIRHGLEYVDEMEDCGVDMLLAGHLHLAYHDDWRSHYKAAKRSILSVQAGTATSTHH